MQVEGMELSIECTETVIMDLDLLVNGINELEAAGLRIYPNPASHNLRIEGLMGWSDRGMVQCLNALGQVVLEHSFQSTETLALPVTELANGIYMFRLMDGSEKGRQPIQTSVLIQR